MKNRYKKRTMLCALLALSWVLGLTACASSGNKEKNASDTAAAAQTELQEKEEASTAQTELQEKEEVNTDQTELQEKEETDTEPETGSGFGSSDSALRTAADKALGWMAGVFPPAPLRKR